MIKTLKEKRAVLGLVFTILVALQTLVLLVNIFHPLTLQANPAG